MPKAIHPVSEGAGICIKEERVEMRSIIDIHAHVLPKVDDGARSLKEGCKLLKTAASQGVTAVIATPHYSRRRQMYGLEELAESLQHEIQKEYPEFAVYLGQETYYHEELPRRVAEGAARTMAGSRYVLVEFDPGDTYERIFRGIRALRTAGYSPILAHIERYGCLRKEERMQELGSSGCLFQMNYGSLKGHLFNQDVRWCRRQVSLGRVQLLGTDMHRTDFRPPEITEPMKWLENHIEERLLDAMTRKNPLHIINNEKIDREKTI